MTPAKLKKVRLALEVAEETLNDFPYDYDAEIYKYRDKKDKRKKTKILLGIKFPNLLSQNKAELLAHHLADQIRKYALPVKTINYNTWYICFDL